MHEIKLFIRADKLCDIVAATFRDVEMLAGELHPAPGDTSAC